MSRREWVRARTEIFAKSIRLLPPEVRPLASCVAVGSMLLVIMIALAKIASAPLARGYGYKVLLELQLRGYSDGYIATSEMGVTWALILGAVGLCIFSALCVSLWWLLPRPSHVAGYLGAFGKAGWGLGIGASVCELGASALAVFSVDRNPTWLELDWWYADDLVLTLTVLKWCLLVMLVSHVLWLVESAAVDRKSSIGPLPRPETRTVGIGTCFSGGGIRSAGFSLGALRAFEASGFMSRVGAIAAVSGGNYAATGWMIARSKRAVDDTNLAADEVIVNLLTPNPFDLTVPTVPAAVGETSHAATDAIDPGQYRPVASSLMDPSSIMKPLRHRTKKGNHRFLNNGPGHLGRAIWWGSLAIASNVVQIGAFIVFVGWPLGMALGWHYPGLDDVLSDRPDAMPIDYDRLPSIALVCISVPFVVFAPLFPPKGRNVLRSIGIGAVGAGTLLFVLLWGGPWLLVQVSQIDAAFVRVGLASIVGAVGAVARVVVNPLRRSAPRLGGILLLIAVIAFVGKSVKDAASGVGLFDDYRVWLGAMLLTVLFSLVVDTQCWSLRELYRARLTKAFVVESARPTPLRKRREARRKGTVGKLVGTEWHELPLDGTGPELIVCCAASRVGLAPNGIPAETFTISQHQVAHYRADGSVTLRTSDYMAQLNGLAVDFLHSPAGWLATSGAAFASAMGQSSLGSTNGLMAALNIDLGIWLPSPKTVSEGRNGFPRVRLGHLSNEIFGVYVPNDEYVFVADGGHVENLGLIELLRRQARLIVCVDASRDEPGTFATFESALRMADTQLDDGDDESHRLFFDKRELKQRKDPPLTNVYRIPFCRWTDRDKVVGKDRRIRELGRIYLIKLEVSLDMPVKVRAFANSDPKFPNYSTGNQLLDDQQFVFLLLAGHRAAENAIARMTLAGDWPTNTPTSPCASQASDHQS